MTFSIVNATTPFGIGGCGFEYLPHALFTTHPKKPKISIQPSCDLSDTAPLPICNRLCIANLFII